jgi:hypothetical protein
MMRETCAKADKKISPKQSLDMHRCALLFLLPNLQKKPLAAFL